MLDLDHIRRRVEEQVIQEPLFLVGLELTGGGGARVLRFLADSDTGITVDQLAGLNRAIGNLLDEEDLVPFSYRLEVFSPGLDRPLTHERQLKRHVGMRVRVCYKETAQDEEAPRWITLTGRLQSLDESQLCLATDKGEVLIERNEIKDIHCELQ